MERYFWFSGQSKETSGLSDTKTLGVARARHSGVRCNPRRHESWTPSAVPTRTGGCCTDEPLDRSAELAGKRTGYPTQKPLALLERIILASSDPGDMVLDPFCGCARLLSRSASGCQWVGMEFGTTASRPVLQRLVDDRVAEDRGLWGGATALTEPPKRTDLGDLPNYRTKRRLPTQPLASPGAT